MKLSKHLSPSGSPHPHAPTIPQPDQFSALLLVDLQNDFFQGDAMPIPEANLLIPLINTYIRHFNHQGLPILATRDWHPPNHTSFLEQQGIWPPHCVQGSRGAQFHPDAVMPPGMIVISKGTDPRKNAQSGFDGTSLADRLEDLHVHTLFVLGLETDHCIRHAVLEGPQYNLQVVLLMDATRIHSKQRNSSLSRQELAEAGVYLATTSDFAFAAAGS